MNPALLLRALTFGFAAALAAISPARAETVLDKVSFGTNWVAEAEHGGFFQAVADGTYRNYGLDVTIVPGGPNVNNRMLLISGKLDFFMSANTLQSFDAVANNVPVVAIAAIFQKDPQVLLTHPNSKAAKLQDLKPLTLFVSKEGVSSYFQWLKSEYGFSEARIKPYTFNAQPFLADRQSAMQGYVTWAVRGRKAAKFAGDHLLAIMVSTPTDPGRDRAISSTRSQARRSASSTPRSSADTYLYGDNAPGNALIRSSIGNDDELLAYSVEKMKEYDIVDSGDALRDGIGAMRDERVASFFDKMVRAGVVRPNIDFRKAYTLRFVNKGVGLDLRPKN
jgi:NitT/TauT family transport system substrate-binding protein